MAATKRLGAASKRVVLDRVFSSHSAGGHGFGHRVTLNVTVHESVGIGEAMKISGNQGVQATRRKGKAEAQNAAPTAAAPKDSITVAGIPQAELTPRVMRALTDLMEEVATLRQELAETQSKMAELSTMAFTDPLTGVYNRRAFVNELNRTLAIVQRHDQAAALAYFDIDDMKSINDHYGHAGGDAAIVHLAQMLMSNVRQTDVVGRLGGDEFAVIFNYAEKDAAAGKVLELQKAINEKSVELNGAKFSMSVTVGIAPIAQGATVETTLNFADAEMYRGKREKE